jgi:DNA-binding response OmpR family regulator
MLADLLGDAGYGVLQAGDGFEALQQLRGSPPDLVVLDLMLPGLSGWQFLEHSREQLDRAKIPVLVLSAIRGGSDYPATLGVAAWLTKPLDGERFLRAVEELLESSASDYQISRRGGAQEASRVLVVEDDRPIRDLIVEYLADEGFAPEAAGSISEARARIAAARPALILLDLMLPGHSGWVFLQERGNDPLLAGLPVLVVSAAPPDRLREAKQLGADAFLSKPFDVDALGALVRSFVR